VVTVAPGQHVELELSFATSSPENADGDTSTVARPPEPAKRGTAAQGAQGCGLDPRHVPPSQVEAIVGFVAVSWQ
jgi:hypothetical protein